MLFAVARGFRSMSCGATRVVCNDVGSRSSSAACSSAAPSAARVTRSSVDVSAAAPLADESASAPMANDGSSDAFMFSPPGTTVPMGPI